jgi:hypothetical protein
MVSLTVYKLVQRLEADVTKIVRGIALTLNVFLVASAIWGEIILPAQLLRGPVLARELIKIVAAGTAVIAILRPSGGTRH